MPVSKHIGVTETYLLKRLKILHLRYIKIHTYMITG